MGRAGSPEVQDDVLVDAALRELPQVSVLVFDCDLRFRAVRGGAAEAHGYLPERTVGRRAPDVMPAAAWEVLGPLYRRALTGETLSARVTLPGRDAAQDVVLQPVRSDGVLIGGMATARDAPVSAPPAGRSAGHLAVPGLVPHGAGSVVDLAALMRSRAELDALQARTQAILDHAPLNIFLRDLDGRWLSVSRELQRVLGRSEAELIGQTSALTHSRERQQRFSAEDRQVLAGGVPQQFDVTFPDASRGGEERHFWLQKFPVRDAAGETIGLGGISLDVTDRERTQRELLAAQDRFAAAFKHAPVGKLISRVESGETTTRVMRCNAAFAEMLGWDPEDIVGRSGVSFVHPDDVEVRDRLIADARRGQRAQSEVRMRHRDGHWIWSLVAPAVVRDADGAEEIIIQALDITERKRVEDQLRHLADHDPLTDLLGRRRFGEDLDREVARVRRYGSPSCLLLLDLDGFKSVNDSFGHSAGDELLVRMSALLRETLRASDVVARIGGDEFGLLLPATDAPSGRHVADRIIAAVARQGSLHCDGRRVAVTASIGMTMLEAGACPDGERLLLQADAAMYQAKQAGRNRAVAFDLETTQSTSGR